METKAKSSKEQLGFVITALHRTCRDWIVLSWEEWQAAMASEIRTRDVPVWVYLATSVGACSPVYAAKSSCTIRGTTREHCAPLAAELVMTRLAAFGDGFGSFESFSHSRRTRRAFLARVVRSALSLPALAPNAENGFDVDMAISIAFRYARMQDNRPLVGPGRSAAARREYGIAPCEVGDPDSLLYITSGLKLQSEPAAERLKLVRNAWSSTMSCYARSVMGESQCAAIDRLILRFCIPEGRSDLLHQPIVFWICPATVSARYVIECKFGHDRKQLQLPWKLDEDVTLNDHVRLEFDPGLALEIDLNDYRFSGDMMRPKHRTAKIRTFHRRTLPNTKSGLFLPPFDFDAYEQSLSPNWPEYQDAVMRPILAFDKIAAAGGVNGPHIGAMAMNISVIRLISLRDYCLEGIYTQKLNLPLDPDHFGLMQIVANAGDFDQFMEVTPGFSTAFVQAIRESEIL